MHAEPGPLHGTHGTPLKKCFVLICGMVLFSLAFARVAGCSRACRHVWMRFMPEGPEEAPRLTRVSKDAGLKQVSCGCSAAGGDFWRETVSRTSSVRLCNLSAAAWRRIVLWQQLCNSLPTNCLFLVHILLQRVSTLRARPGVHAHIFAWLPLRCKHMEIGLNWGELAGGRHPNNGPVPDVLHLLHPAGGSGWRGGGSARIRSGKNRLYTDPLTILTQNNHLTAALCFTTPNEQIHFKWEALQRKWFVLHMFTFTNKS